MNRIKKVKNYNRYPNDFKRKVALEYLSGRFSYAVAAEEYGLKGKDVVKEFVKWYRRNSELEQTTDTAPMAKSKVKARTSKEQELQKRIKDLELKVEALETMIDIAEEQLHIDIRKKSGSQRSKK